MSSHCINLLHISEKLGNYFFLCMDMIPPECTCCASATLPSRIMKKYLKWGWGMERGGVKGLFSHTKSPYFHNEESMHGFSV